MSWPTPKAWWHFGGERLSGAGAVRADPEHPPEMQVPADGSKDPSADAATSCTSVLAAENQGATTTDLGHGRL